MNGRSATDADIAVLRALIDGPDSGLRAYMADRSYLGSADEARDDLARTIVGLEDARAGRVVSHAQILADMAVRRQRHDPQAAE